MTISTYDVILWVLNHERFMLSDTPGDKGGMTFAGIAMNYHPNADVWTVIRPALEAAGDISAFNETLKPGSETYVAGRLINLGCRVRMFYRAYWNEARLDQFWNPDLFGVLSRYFDAAFHDGPQDAARWLQRAMNKRAATFELAQIDEDGIFGPLSQKRLAVLHNLGQKDYLEIEFRAQWQRALMIRGTKWSRAFADRIERPLPQDGTTKTWAMV